MVNENNETQLSLNTETEPTAPAEVPVETSAEPQEGQESTAVPQEGQPTDSAGGTTSTAEPVSPDKPQETVNTYPGETTPVDTSSLQKQLEPFRKILRKTPFIAGSKPMFCDYLLFGFFMWARCSSPKTLLEATDPMREWRERMLDLYDGYARKARGYSNT